MQAETAADTHGAAPWGLFHVLRVGQRHRVQTLTVWPGERTSLHSHRYRREAWTVLEGSLHAHINGKTFTALEGQTLHVGYGEVHRLHNRSEKTPLVVLETQIGSACMVDDITYYDDDYGRILTERQRGTPGEGARSQLASYVPSDW